MTASSDRIWPGRFAGKRALVTGGSRGIGAAIARRLGAEGALVCINYRTDDGEANAVVAAIVDAGGTALAIKADVGSVIGIEAMFDAWDDRCQAGDDGNTRLDILINNAGIALPGSVIDLDERDFDRVMAVNTKAPAFISKLAAARMTAGGRIVTIGSCAAQQPGPTMCVYGASKSALYGLTRSMAATLGRRGITANVVAPAYTYTDLTAQTLDDAGFAARLADISAIPRIGQPDDIAAVACFLASDEAGWVTGQWIEASGGYNLISSI